MNTNQMEWGMNPRVRTIPAKIKTGRNTENADGKKKRIAAYARVSTLNEEQGSSYELQVSYYTEYIQKNPAWELYKVFADEGVTGTSTKNRTGFLEMIQDAEAGKFDYIITKSISRFGRNTLDVIRYVRLLKNLQNPVGIFFEKENIDTLDSKSELLLTILSSMAQEESHSISKNTKWGIQKRFSQGKIHCPTTYFLGYDTDADGNIVVDEEQAAVVRRIFAEFLSGNGTSKIAQGLTKDGVLTARGNATWTSDAVYKILKNEKYMGHCLAQKTVTLDFLTHKRVRNREHQPQYFIKNSLPAIISEDDWNKVQQELKRRKEMRHDPDAKYRTNYSNRAPFSNKLFCGECGRPVTRRRITSQKKGEKYHFTAWQCRVSAGHGREKDVECGSKYAWEEAIEKTFMEVILELKENREQAVQEANMAILECSLSDVEESRLSELERQIEIVEERLSYMASRESTMDRQVYDATLRHLIYEHEILQMERDSLDKNREESIYLKQHLDEFLECIDGIEEPTDDFRDDIFLKTVERGTLYANYLIEFRFKCGIKRTAEAKRTK